mgnify:CR=1 FL=1
MAGVYADDPLWVYRRIIFTIYEHGGGVPLWGRSQALRILTAGTGTNSISQSGHGPAKSPASAYKRHAGDPLAELACYLRRCAEHWGRSPAPCEIVGGSYIAERFGSWSDALRAAHLNPAYSHPHNRSNGRYQREKKRQIELYRVERDAKRAEREKKNLERQRIKAEKQAAEAAQNT